MKGRPAGEVMVLMVVATVCLVVILGTVAVGVIEVINPATNTDSIVNAISGILATLLGLIAGFIAGRTDRRNGGPK